LPGPMPAEHGAVSGVADLVASHGPRA
jgi:hypothetical protein